MNNGNLLAERYFSDELFRRHLVPRYLSGRLVAFAEEHGILEEMKARGACGRDEMLRYMADRLGYMRDGGSRQRMLKVLIDLLTERGIVMSSGGRLIPGDARPLETGLTESDMDLLRGKADGQISFFRECLGHAGRFLRGGPPLYGFDRKSAAAWKEFLGNPEFRAARSALCDILLSGRTGSLEVLDLCAGPGYDLPVIMEHRSVSRISVLDFTDVFYDTLPAAVQRPGLVELTDPGLWKGFGSALPFADRSFDCVFFACADPYIPAGLREFVYSDIFRVLKPGGSLGMLSRCYPDAGAVYVKDRWIRLGTYCHDFAESVCAGWQGFCDPADAADLFGRSGYSVGSISLNASLWRLDKPCGM